MKIEQKSEEEKIPFETSREKNGRGREREREGNSFEDSHSFIMAAIASTSVLSLFPVGIDSKSEEERRICCLCNKGLARKYLFTFLRVCDLMSSSRCVHSSHFFSFSLSFSVLFSSLVSSGHSTLSNHMKKKHRCNPVWTEFKAAQDAKKKKSGQLDEDDLESTAAASFFSPSSASSRGTKRSSSPSSSSGRVSCTLWSAWFFFAAPFNTSFLLLLPFPIPLCGLTSRSLSLI